MALLLREAEVAELLPMADAIEAVEEAFRLLGEGQAVNRSRVRLQAGEAILHVMSAGLPPAGVMGLKTYSSVRGRTRFVVLLFDVGTGELLAMMEADRLGQIRTGAASGVATRHLARPDAGVVGLLGSGWQARGQLLAVAAVRKLRRVQVWSPNAERCARFCREMTAALDCEVRPASGPEAVVRGAEILVTATNARTPVLQGAWLQPGTHINAVGSNFAQRQEVDEETVDRSALVVVDSKEQARIEAGDLLPAIARGLLSWEQVHELSEVVTGALGRPDPAEAITLFESQGVALEDVAVAARVYARAREAGAGEPLTLVP